MMGGSAAAVATVQPGFGRAPGGTDQGAAPGRG
jgi:hypothetical protein